MSTPSSADARPDFVKCGNLLPVITQDAATGEVLMLAYMNEEEIGRAHV